ncbi:MAG: thioredoxin family protein [Ignavibacteria bacterium]|nr:thioredoxin family protein [Ignavibacteria bacterium]
MENHYGVEHQSPQILVIKNGKCIYTASHSAIRYDDLMDEVERINTEKS